MYFQMFYECYILRGTETDRLCYTILCMHWCRLPQISCFTHSLKCFSSDSDIYSNVGIGNPLQFFHPPKKGPVLQTLLFPPLVPSSYWVFVILFILFPLVSYSCQLSAGVLQALCVWRCIPDMSRETDVLQVHLSLCHLVYLNILTIINKIAMNIHLHIFEHIFHTFWGDHQSFSLGLEAKPLEVKKEQMYSLQSHRPKTGFQTGN